MHSIVKYCFPLFPILRILTGTHRTDLFVEVTNLMKGNTIWAPRQVTIPHQLDYCDKFQKKKFA